MRLRRKTHITKLTSEQTLYLKRLHGVGYKSALIAGGAVRDTYFKRRISDVDIFVWHPQFSKEKVNVPPTVHADWADLTNDAVLNVIFHGADAISTSFNRDPKKYKPNIPKHCDSTDIYMYGSNHVLHIKNVMKHGVKYQIILIQKTPLDYVMNHFYVDLTRCYCDGNRLRYTNEFLTDAKNKTLTIAGKMTQGEYLYGLDTYMDKMKYKFPDYKVIDTLAAKYKKK